jgi:hypothetical protein
VARQIQEKLEALDRAGERARRGFCHLHTSVALKKMEAVNHHAPPLFPYTTTFHSGGALPSHIRGRTGDRGRVHAGV